MTSSRIAVCATLVVICLAGGSLLGQRAGSIDTITPAAARPGDSVTITGRGFGAINVRVTVGGVPAVVLSATGSLVTFRIPDGTPVGSTQVIATNPGGQSGSITFHIIEGILLPGNASARMKDATFDLLPEVGVSADQIVNGVMMTRLVVRFAADATVGQVNAALVAINGGIIGMSKGQLALSIAVPRAASVDELNAAIATLEQMPGVRLAHLAQELLPALSFFDPNAEVYRTDPTQSYAADTARMHQLLPSRFPAAWNAFGLAFDQNGNCVSGQVPLLIADYFSRQPPAGLETTLPNVAAPAAPASGFPAERLRHGWAVSAIAAAQGLGANPFITLGCLDVQLVQIGGFMPNLATDQISRHLPSTKSIVNFSIGFQNECAGTPETPGTPCLPAHDRLTVAKDRADDTLYWKTKTRDRWSTFLIVASAGNARDKESTTIYPGMGDSRFNNAMGISQLGDTHFQFVTDSRFWQPDPAFVPFGFESLIPDALHQQRLADSVTDAGAAGQAVEDNVIIVGSATRQTAGSVLSAHVPAEQLGVSVFSNEALTGTGPDVLAVGEEALNDPLNTGTSAAAPLVSGLASYLWMISPELRAEPIAKTKQIIVANTRNRIIDAYASVLALDLPAPIAPGRDTVREALLNVNTDDGLFIFNEADLNDFIRHLFIVDPGGTIVGIPPGTPADFTKYDLNGDGFTTAGALRERFDLDRDSAQFGGSNYSVVTQKINGLDIHFDENALTDLEILCYYAYSPLYVGDPGIRDDKLKGRCGISIEPSTVTLQTGAQQQFTAHTPDNSAVNFSTTGGSITSTGLLTAPSTPGTVTVRATSASDPNAFAEATVTVSGGNTPGHGSGDVFANASGHTQFDPDCTDLSINSADNVQSFSKSLHCAGHFTGKPPENQTFSATGDATTTFSETDLLGELTSATATGVYVTTATALGNFDPNLPPSFHDNAVSEAKGSYRLSFTVSQTRTVRLTGTLTGNDSSNFLEFSCGSASGQQAGAGPIDRTFTLHAGEICAINAEARARSRANPPPQTQSPTAGFALHVDVH